MPAPRRAAQQQIPAPPPATAWMQKPQRGDKFLVQIPGGARGEMVMDATDTCIRDHVTQDANFIQRKHENSYLVLTTDTLITAMKPITDLFNQFNQLNVLDSLV